MSQVLSLLKNLVAVSEVPSVFVKFTLPISTAPVFPENVVPVIYWGSPAPAAVKFEVKLVTPAFVTGIFVHSPTPATPVKTHQSPTFQSPGVVIGFVDLKLFG